MSKLKARDVDLLIAVTHNLYHAPGDADRTPIRKAARKLKAFIKRSPLDEHHMEVVRSALILVTTALESDEPLHRHTRPARELIDVVLNATA